MTLQFFMTGQLLNSNYGNMIYGRELFIIWSATYSVNKDVFKKTFVYNHTVLFFYSVAPVLYLGTVFVLYLRKLENTLLEKIKNLPKLVLLYLF